MKNWVIIVLFLFLFLLGGFFFFIKTIAPRAAAVFIPIKWQNIPLGESKTVVHNYLGEPDTVIAANDHWEHKLNANKKYLLDIMYSGDTLCVSYKLTYNLNIVGFQQSTVIRSDTLN
jgi:hypothetical protein